MKSFFLSIFIAGFVFGCGVQGPVVIKSVPHDRDLPGSERSSSIRPSEGYAPLPYSSEYVLGIFNPHPYPVRVIIGGREEYIETGQKLDIFFEKGFESRGITVYAIFLDSEMKKKSRSIGTYIGEITIPARGRGGSEGSLVLDRIKKFRYLKKRR